MSAPFDTPTASARALTPTSALSPAQLASKAQLESSLTRLRSLALLMDDRFELPIVGVRFGLDPLIGLMPGWGDWVAWSISAYILVEGVRLGLPLNKLLIMAFHAGFDLITGYVPGIGDIIDVAYKANRRNVNTVLTHFGAEPITFSKGGTAGSHNSGPRAVDAPPSDNGPQHMTGANGADPVVVPNAALALRRRATAAHWLVTFGLVLALAALAAVPAMLVWWYWSQR